MQLITFYGCISTKMIPEKAINTQLHNTAYAMDVQDIAGSIAKVK